MSTIKVERNPDFLDEEAREALERKLGALEQRWEKAHDERSASAVHNRRGLIFLELGEPDRAIEEFTAAIEIHPENGHAYNNRGFAWLSVGNVHDAREDCARALDLDENLSPQNFFLASEAIRFLEENERLTAQISEGGEGLADLHNQRGLIRLSFEGTATAREDFARALELDPEHDQAFNNLAFTAINDRDTELLGRLGLGAAPPMGAALAVEDAGDEGAASRLSPENREALQALTR